MKKNLRIIGMVCWLLVVFFGQKPKVSAAGVNFGQGILPVRFVYVTPKGEITRIWSNVTTRDSVYVVKFFLEQASKEKGKEKGIATTEKLMRAYEAEMLKSIRLENARKDAAVPFLSTSVDFIKKDKALEEVQTIL